MENLTGGTPPVRYLPCVVPCKLYFAAGYIFIGALIGVSVFLTRGYDSFLIPFGAALVVCGVVRLVDHVRLIRDEKALRRREIQETDERNLALAQRARGMAMGLYVFVAGTAVVVLQLLRMPEASQITAYNVCLLVALYWLCHVVVRRRS